jgi:hypothetical protein
MQGRSILDGVAILQETIHELHSKKLNGVILKIDFEKAYDKVKWSILEQTFRMKDFSPEWRALIYSFVSRGIVAIKVNDDIGHYFHTNRGTPGFTTPPTSKDITARQTLGSTGPHGIG